MVSASIPSSLSEMTLDTTVNHFRTQLSNSTTTHDLEKLIDAIDDKLGSINNGLDVYIRRSKTNHSKDTSDIELNRVQLANSLDSSNNLVKLLSNANSLGKNITEKVRLLDLEIDRVQLTSKYVKNIQLLKENINQAAYSIEKRDWVKAAQSISIMRGLPQELINGKFAGIVIPSADIPLAPQVAIDNWIADLKVLFVQEFNRAALERNVQSLTKFFSLFPLIGEASIGLDCYSKFICTIISDQSRQLISNNSNLEKSGFFTAASMKLFENISTMLNQHTPIIAKYYGVDAITTIVYKIQREIDTQAGLISDTFYDTRRIERTLSDIQNYKFPILTSIFVNSGDQTGRESLDIEQDMTSVVEIGDLVGELSSILNHWALYCRFIALKYDASSKPDEAEPDLLLPKTLKESNYTNKIYKKYLPSFDALATFYLRRSLEKAFTIEDLPELELDAKVEVHQSPDNPAMSSVIEDTILVLNTTLRQSVETGQPITAKNMILNSTRILENDLLGVINLKLSEFQPRGSTGLQFPAKTDSRNISRTSTPPIGNSVGNMLRRGANTAFNAMSGDVDHKVHNFVIYLNSISLAGFYLGKVIDNICATLPGNYPFGTDSDKVKKLMEGMKGSIQKKSKFLLNNNIDILFEQVFKNKLRTLVSDLFPTTEQYLVSSLNDNSGVIIKFLANWKLFIQPYYQVLSKEIFDNLLERIIVFFSDLLLRRIWTLEKKITELGSIKLERDISSIISEITKTRYSLRDKFIRITQIIMILGFDDETDEIDMSWVLTPSERKRARDLRIDRKDK